MARDIEEKAGTGAPPPQKPFKDDENSSGSDTPPVTDSPPDRELTEDEIAALKARVINENEEKQEELKKERGPIVPGASFWMKKDDPMFERTATQASIYDNVHLAKYFQPHPKYENLHRFDPTERWTWREEMVC